MLKCSEPHHEGKLRLHSLKSAVALQEATKCLSTNGQETVMPRIYWSRHAMSYPEGSLKPYYTCSSLNVSIEKLG